MGSPRKRCQDRIRNASSSLEMAVKERVEEASVGGEGLKNCDAGLACDGTRQGESVFTECQHSFKKIFCQDSWESIANVTCSSNSVYYRNGPALVHGNIPRH